MERFFLSVFVLFAALAIGSHAYVQEMRLEYKSNDTSGNSFDCTSRFHSQVSNSSILSLGNVNRICFHGFWQLFNTTSFDSRPTYWVSHQEECRNATDFSYLSFRHGGLNDTSVASISLYTDKYFQGQETLVDGIAYANIPNALSLALTAGSKWTLFSGSNFNGSSACAGRFTDDTWEVDYFVDVSINFSLQHVGSVVKGCDEKTPNLEPLQKSH